MFTALFSAFTIGLIGGIIPGPVLTAVFTEILNSNFTKSLKLIFWGMFVELVLGIVSLIVLSALDLGESVFRVLSFIGAGVLIWLAYELWKLVSIDTGKRSIFTPSKLATIIVTNGVVWTFWLTVVIPQAILLKETNFYADYLYIMSVVFGLSIATVTLGFIFSRFKNLLSKPKALPVVFKVFSLAFIYFAANMIIGSVKYFF